MTNELKLFDFNTNDIRVIDMDGELWFPAKDVCDLLGLANPSQVVRDLCQTTEMMYVMRSSLRSTDASFPNRGMLCVSESGLYALIFKSRKPEAEAFRYWVTNTGLPAIRKTGGYIAGEEKVATGEMSDDDLIAAALKIVNRKLDAIAAERALKTAGRMIVEAEAV